MANILYGVNGEGAGHSTRSKEVIAHLIGRCHTVHVVSSDRGLRNLSADFDVTEIYGWHLEYVHNRVRYRKTVLKNLLSSPRAARSSRELQRLADEWNIDLVCTDFEPLSCHVGHKRRVSVISIDNQHCLTNTNISYPRECRKEALAAKLVTRAMIQRADAYLVTSFFTPEVKRRNTYIVPPILRKEVLETPPEIGDYVLVYVTSAALELAELLKSVRYRFICYGFGREGTDGNLLFKKPDLQGFLADLARCAGIIGNSGFSLISEALYLAKPYLAWPVARQFEQVFNAYHLARAGYGAYWDELNKERVDSFLFNMDRYRDKLQEYPRCDNSVLFGKLDDLIGEYT